jgi:large subunit ribosomal protein L15
MSDFVLHAPKGANKKKRIVGRGSSSGRGTTAGKGNKGQQSRSGGKVYVGFEGGQMPLYRRIPKRGFTNINSKEITIINLDKLEAFNDGDTVTVESLIEKGIIKKVNDGVKILGNGELTKKLNVQVNAYSASAKERIEALGGKAEVI